MVGAGAAFLAQPLRAQSGYDTRAHVIDFSNGPYFDRDESPHGLDGTNSCTKPNHHFLEQLREQGIDTVIRYYSDQNNAGLTCKNITRRERDLLHEHGFSIAIVYQYEGRRKNRYTGNTALSDSDFIAERARVIGQPEGSTIYIGVDSDASLNTDQGVIEYFKVLNDKLGDRYEIGVYAAGARCQLLMDTQYQRHVGSGYPLSLASKFWVPEAPAWAGTRDFMNSGYWTFYQNKTDIRRSALVADMGQPVVIDTNIINSYAGDSIGAFGADGTIRSYDYARLDSIIEARAWAIDDTVQIRDRPDGAKLIHACIARTVHVLERQGDWALVDIDEDGQPEGYCLVRGLAPFSEMPNWRSGCKPPAI